LIVTVKFSIAFWDVSTEIDQPVPVEAREVSVSVQSPPSRGASEYGFELFLLPSNLRRIGELLEVVVSVWNEDIAETSSDNTSTKHRD
jgi:hypothetical protein